MFGHNTRQQKADERIRVFAAILKLVGECGTQLEEAIGARITHNNPFGWGQNTLRDERSFGPTMVTVINAVCQDDSFNPLFWHVGVTTPDKKLRHMLRVALAQWQWGPARIMVHGDAFTIKVSSEVSSRYSEMVVGTTANR